MSEYYNNIEDLTLIRFRNVIIKADYKQLLKSGEFDVKEAEKVWLNIYDEYNNVIKSKSVDVTFEFKKQVEILSIEKGILNTCLFAITEFSKVNIINNETTVSIKPFVDELNKYGYNFDTKKSLPDEIKRVERQIKNYNTRINGTIEKIKTLQEETKDWTIDDTIGTVEKFMGWEMKDTCTVKKFTIYLNMLITNGQKKEDNG